MRVDIGSDENHIERNQGILHPHRDAALGFEVEQHTVTIGQFFAKHEPSLTFFVRGRNFNREDMDAAFADDLQILQFCSANPGGRRQTRSKQDGHKARLRGPLAKASAQCCKTSKALKRENPRRAPNFKFHRSTPEHETSHTTANG